MQNQITDLDNLIQSAKAKIKRHMPDTIAKEGNIIMPESPHTRSTNKRKRQEENQAHSHLTLNFDPVLECVPQHLPSTLLGYMEYKDKVDEVKRRNLETLAKIKAEKAATEAAKAAEQEQKPSFRRGPGRPRKYPRSVVVDENDTKPRPSHAVRIATDTITIDFSLT